MSKNCLRLQSKQKNLSINERKKGARKFGILHLQPEVTNTMKLNAANAARKRKQTNQRNCFNQRGLIEIDVARKDNNRCLVVWLATKGYASKREQEDTRQTKGPSVAVETKRLKD